MALAISDEAEITPVLDPKCNIMNIMPRMSESQKKLFKNVRFGKTNSSSVAGKAMQENNGAKFFGLVVAAAGPITGLHSNSAMPWVGGWFEAADPLFNLGLDAIQVLQQNNPGIVLTKARLWNPTFYLDKAREE